MRRRTTATAALLALVLLGVGVAAVVAADGGSGAATAAGTVEVTGDAAVELAPAATANGRAYASLEDGELALSLDGLNDRAETTADDVFTIAANGSRPVAVTVESDADGVSFYRADDPERSMTEAVDLAPGESVAVGVAVDTTGDVTSGTFRVNASVDGGVVRPTRPPETDGEDDRGHLRIESVDVQPRELRPGGTATTTVTVSNDGLERREARLEFAVGGTVVDRRTVRVQPRDESTVRFERQFDQPGEYEVSVNGAPAGTVTVREGTGGFVVSNASVRPATIHPGEAATVTADVTNRGDEAGQFTAELAVGGTVVDARTVGVEPGETAAVAFERTFRHRGTYEVAVSGESAGTVRVESESDAAIRRYGSRYGWLLGVLSAPAAGGALLAARRRRGS